MNIKDLKNFLSLHPEKIKYILEELEFHHIKFHNGSSGCDSYFQFGNFDGDSPTAVTLYLSSNLLCIDYTRELSRDKANTDFIDLVCWARKDFNFFQNIKWITEKADINYYHNFDEGIPESLKILKLLKDLLNKDGDRNSDEDEPIKVKDEVILSYYAPYLSGMFFKDGVSWSVQQEFGIKYDFFSNRHIIPIYDEIGNLVGIKGRYFKRKVPDNEQKFLFLESCPKNKILFGFNKTAKYIKEENTVLVFEAEKSVMVAYSHGYKNSVATMGKKISKIQIDKLSRLGCKIVICFDKDVKMEELESIASKFTHGIPVYAMYDFENKMKDTDSPVDNMEVFKFLFDNCIVELSKKEI